MPVTQEELIDLVNNQLDIPYVPNLDILYEYGCRASDCFTIVETDNAAQYSVIVYKDCKLYEYKRAPKDCAKTDIDGTTAYRMFQNAYKKQFGNRTYELAGTTSNEIYDRCQYSGPSTLVWVDEDYVSSSDNIQIINRFNKVDISSAYASAFRLLDNINTYEIKGYHNFDEFPEYDVAFYPDTNNVAVKGEFDTHQLIHSQWAFIFNRIKKKSSKRYGERIATDSEDNVTIFFNFYKSAARDVIQTLYDERSINPVNKQVLNLFIGYNYSDYNKNQNLDSIVAYWTHINKMVKAADMIELSGGHIVQFATDCIGWIGNKVPIGINEKKLGEFHIEHVNAKAVIKACGVYSIEDNGVITVAHQGSSLTQEQLDYIKQDITYIVSPLTDPELIKFDIINGKPYMYIEKTSIIKSDINQLFE